jgi:hypothetical protein
LQRGRSKCSVSIKQCCGSGSGRIWACLIVSRSGRHGLDPDSGLNKLPVSYIKFFGVCKGHKYFRNLCCFNFWFMNILFRAYLRHISDPDVFKSRIRILSKIVRIRYTDKKLKSRYVKLVQRASQNKYICRVTFRI